MWFDVERRYKTILPLHDYITQELWFDVERRYKTITPRVIMTDVLLWFDVERRYKTIQSHGELVGDSCGLM